MIKSNRDVFNKERIEIFYPSHESYSFKLGRVSYSKAHPPIGEHVHEGMMEIVLIVKGRQNYTVGGNDYTVNSGEVFITFADEKHSSSVYPEDKSLLYYMIINVEMLKDGFIGYDEKDGRSIFRALECIEKRVFKVDADLKNILDKIIYAYYSDCCYKNTVLRNLVSGFIISLVECESKMDSGYGQCMQRVLDFIEQNIFEDISISALAEIAELSEARFKANFRKQIGIPPREFVLRRKIETAQSMLKNSDISITELAHTLSFSSSQYFATVFKRFTLMSPNAFKQKAVFEPADKACNERMCSYGSES